MSAAWLSRDCYPTMLNSIATRLFLVVASVIVFLRAPVEAKIDDVLLAKLFQHDLWGLFANETALTHPGPDKGRRYPMYRAFYNQSRRRVLHFSTRLSRPRVV